MIAFAASLEEVRQARMDLQRLYEQIPPARRNNERLFRDRVDRVLLAVEKALDPAGRKAEREASAS